MIYKTCKPASFPMLCITRVFIVFLRPLGILFNWYWKGTFDSVKPERKVLELICKCRIAIKTVNAVIFSVDTLYLKNLTANLSCFLRIGVSAPHKQLNVLDGRFKRSFLNSHIYINRSGYVSPKYLLTALNYSGTNCFLKLPSRKKFLKQST